MTVESCIGGGLQLVRDPSSGGLQLVRDPGSSIQLMRDPNSNGLQLMRDPNSNNLQLMRDPNSNGLQLMRDPNSNSLQLMRDPNSSGIQLLRDPASSGLQLVRDPASGALLLLPPAYLQPQAPVPPPPPMQPQHMHDMWQEQFQQAVVWGGYSGVGTGVLLPPMPPPLPPLQLLGAELLTASTTLHHHTTHQTHHSTRLVALSAEPKARPSQPPPPQHSQHPQHPRDQGVRLYQLACRDRPNSPGTPPPPIPPDVQDASNQTDTPTPSEEEELNSNHAAECASEDVKHIIIPRSMQQHDHNMDSIRITSGDNNIRITTGDNNIQITPMLYSDSAVQTKREPKTPGIEHFNSLSEPVVEVPAAVETSGDYSDNGSQCHPTLQEESSSASAEETEEVGEFNGAPSVVAEPESQNAQPDSNLIVAIDVTADPISNELQISVSENYQKPDSPPQIKVVEVIQLQKPTIQVDLSGLELLSNSIEQFETRAKNMESSPSKNQPLLHMPSLTDHVTPTSSLSVDVKNSLHPPPVILIKSSPKSPKPASEMDNSHFNFPPTKSFQTNICDDNSSLGGLGLLCALAEQRFMEEEEERRSEHGSASAASTNEENTQEAMVLPNIKIEKQEKFYTGSFVKAKDEFSKNKQEIGQPKSNQFRKTPSDQRRTSLEQSFKKEFETAKQKYFDKEEKERFNNYDNYKDFLSAMRTSAERKSFDKQKKDLNHDNRILDKPRISERSRTSSTSTMDTSDLIESLDKSYMKFGKCDCKDPENHTCKERAKWLSSMNDMERDMIVRLADLKRQYKEKQRELSKLSPTKKSPEDPFKRGPGRPRKKSATSDRASSPNTEAPHTLGFRLKPATGIFTSSFSSYSLNETSPKAAERIPTLVKLSEDENSHLNDSRENHRSVSPIADSNSSQSSITNLSSSKKRKVGRPKKLLSTPGSRIATETIVAKKPKSKSSLVGYLLAAKSRLNLPTSKGGIIYSKTNPPRPCEEDNSSKKITTKNYKGLKLKTNLKPSENNCYSSPASSISEYKYPVGYDVKQKYASLLSSDSNTGSKMRPKLKAEPKLKEYSEEDDVNNDWCGSQSNLTDVKSQSSSMESLQEVHLKNKQKTDQLALKHKKIVVPKSAGVKKKRDLKALYESSDSEVEKTPKKRRMSKLVEPKTPPASKANTAIKLTKPEKSVKKRMDFKDDYDASNSENEEQTKNKKATAEVVVAKEVETADVLAKTIDRGRCTLALDDLGGDVRVLTAMGGLFYAGSLRAVRAPDVYAVTLDGERGNRPHILCREEALRDAILEVLPASTSELFPGTRLCAYWSQQYRCLYPGTVAEPSTPDPLTDHKFVSVEFDDGDSGRIALEDIRLLQPDYPIVEYDLNPLLTLSKRRRQTSVNSAEDKKGNTSISSTTSSELNNSVHPLPKIGTGLETFVSTSEQSQLEAEFSHRERKRLKKHKKEKLKKMLSRSGDENSNVEDFIRKKKKKHKCCDDHCKHRKHHKKHHRKHKRHHHSSSKEHSGSSSEDPTRSAMLATAFDKSPFFAIKDVSVDLSTSMDVSVSSKTPDQEVTPKAGTNKTTVKKKPTKVLKRPLLNKSVKINKGKKITVTDVVEQNGCLEFVTNTEAVDADNPGGPLVKKIKITNTNSKKMDKEGDNYETEEDYESDSTFELTESDTKKDLKKAKKRSSSSTSECGGSKMAAFLPAGAQLWSWRGAGHRRPQARGRARKCFYRAIQRGTEVINVGESAVFLSTGRPDRPYIGQVESLWEGWQGGMAVKVRWYYHPEETLGCPGTLASPGGLFESPHTDENDVQTISHRCEVLPLAQYKLRLSSQPQKCDSNDTYYLAGHYDPTQQTLRMEPDIPFAEE